MCFRPNRATASRRRSLPRRQTPTSPPLAMLDLSKPGERQAHDFLVRATTGRDRMWQLIALHRHGHLLLCVVRWVQLETITKPFSLAEVSLTEAAVCWREYVTAGEARSDMGGRADKSG